MKKFLSLIMILSLITVFCITSCDQEHGDSGSGGGSENGDGNNVVAITNFTISPTGTISMTVDETKDFTITYEPANATVTNIRSDLTYDINLEFFYPVSSEYIKFDSAAHSITITVRAKKAGTTTISASLINNPNINGNVTLNIKEKDQSGDDGEDDNNSVPANITTIDVTIDCVDLTMDNITRVVFKYCTGDYQTKKAKGNIDWATKKINNVHKATEDGRNGTISFTIEDEGLGEDEMKLFYYIRLIDDEDNTIGNLIYQDTRKIMPKTRYSLNVAIDDIYGDADVNVH